MSQQAKPTKVLVVDDDPVIRDMMIDMLDFEGYPIQVVRSGIEALHILRGDGNFLVFLDLMMPGLSGKEVCAILDAEPQVRNRHIIVMMTAMDRLDEAQSLHADAILFKPFVVEDVVNVIEKFMV
ncbi:MAG TPA: response regulator [Ktedonobacteraceae bacterium]|jgi:CheY-like chemotaxis protein|nr:response regulator [Ktedonobacteraceae bacterium]